MTKPNHPYSSSFAILEEWFKICANSMNMFSKYWLAYIKAVSPSTDSVNPSNYSKLAPNTYNPFFTPSTLLSHFIDVSNSELKKQLCSQDFLQDFKNCIESTANLDSIQKQIFQYSSFSYLDSLIDQSLAPTVTTWFLSIKPPIKL